MTQSRQSSKSNKAEEKNHQADHEAKISTLQSVANGSIAGAIEVLCDHPMWTFKTRKQMGLPRTYDPALLYRGMVPFMFSMAPTTAVQVGMNRFIHNAFFRDKESVTTSQKLGSAFASGVASAFVSCPTEMILSRQITVGGSFYAAGKHLYQKAGMQHLYTGLRATMVRDGGFSGFLLGVSPMLKAEFESRGMNKYVASVSAGMLAGGVAAFMTQPADKTKTDVQSAKSPLTYRQAFKKLYTEKGVKGFFEAGGSRGLRAASAVTIIGLVNDGLETWEKKGMKK